MKRTIYIITSFILSIVIIDITTGYIGTLLTEKVASYGGTANKIDFTTNRLKTDILIVGSSRAQHHYVCPIIQSCANKVLGQEYTIYNAGLNGHYIDCSCCWIECVMSRQSPRIVILDLDEYEFYEKNRDIENNELFIYYGYNPIVKSYFDRTYSDWKSQCKLHSNLYRFNEELIRLGVLLSKGTNFLTAKEDGYAPLHNVMAKQNIKKSDPQIGVKTQSGIDSKKVDSFKRIIKLCKQRQIKLIVSTSPWYNKNTRSNLIANLCMENNIPYITMDNMKALQKNHELFQDKSHLNDTGARLFTEELCKKLKDIL